MMAVLNVRSSSIKRAVGGILKFKVVLENLQKIFLLSRHESSLSYYEDYEDDATFVPEDVKEGHFVVIAKDEEGQKRFVVPLSYLNNPRFLRLLEHAAEEYGFHQHGALTIPCRASELEMLLAQRNRF